VRQHNCQRNNYRVRRAEPLSVLAKWDHDPCLEQWSVTSAHRRATSSHQKAAVMYVLVKIRRERKMTDNARRIEGTTIRGPTGNLTISCPDEESIARYGTRGHNRRLGSEEGHQGLRRDAVDIISQQEWPILDLRNSPVFRQYCKTHRDKI